MSKLGLSIPPVPTMVPNVTVIGVGGAGCNAINNMISNSLTGVRFVVANTDMQSLDCSLAERKLQLGVQLTKGLGAGSLPEVGRAAAEESIKEIEECIDGCNLLFITAGMGGGTGTGASPVVASAAQRKGILTIAIVTTPFNFEGAHRRVVADRGIAELKNYVDIFVVVNNQNLFRLANESTTLAEAFSIADNFLTERVRGISDLMTKPALINLDFADIRTVVNNRGKAVMGTGEASGENRAIRAAESAISNPLLDEVSLKGSRSILINIAGGRDITLFEVDAAVTRIREESDKDANIIFGSTFSDDCEGKVRVSVIATGLDQEMDKVAVQHALGSVNKHEPEFSPIDAESTESQESEDIDFVLKMAKKSFSEILEENRAGMDTLNIPAFLRRGRKSERV